MSIKGELYKIRNTQKEINELKERIDEEYYSLGVVSVNLQVVTVGFV